MDLRTYLKSAVIRTPLERPLFWLKHVSERFQNRKHPEFRQILEESSAIERALGRLISRSSNCIDVGCHLGALLSLLLRLAPQGKHLAFEPVPRKAAWLRRKFPEVEVHQVALGETPGRVTFYENLTRPGFSGLQATPDATDGKLEYTVDCERLDRYWTPDRRVAFIKLDVEGAEFLVLRGATELIRHDRPCLVFESINGGVERFGRSRREFFDFLNGELNYAIYIAADYLASGDPLDWERFDQAHHYPFKALNFLAIPR